MSKFIAPRQALTLKSWLIPLALLALGVIPIIAGGIRLTQLGVGGATPENARFFASPWPVVIHIISASIYSVLGAFQFASDLRQRKPGWHRVCGRILIPLGLAMSLSGLWMNQFYAQPEHDGFALYVLRIVVGLVTTLFLVLGLAAVRKRKFIRHSSWMIRAYALAMGAGTQVFTHIPWFLVPDIQTETARAFFMGAGWLINLLVAEWIISSRDKTLPQQIYRNERTFSSPTTGTTK
jgi:uncharacterized membrane protein